MHMGVTGDMEGADMEDIKVVVATEEVTEEDMVEETVEDHSVALVALADFLGVCLEAWACQGYLAALHPAAVAVAAAAAAYFLPIDFAIFMNQAR